MRLNKDHRNVAVSLACFYLALMSFTFLHNLPRWCADPQGQGNALIQPICEYRSR